MSTTSSTAAPTHAAAEATLGVETTARTMAEAAAEPRTGITGAQSLVCSLEAVGVEVAFGIPGGASTNQVYDVGLDVGYQLDLFGRIRRGIEAGRADLGATQAAFDLARVTVAAETARAYADACGAGSRLAVARRSVGVQQRTFDLTRRLVAGGRGTANPGVPTIVVAEPGPGLDSDPLTSVQVRWRMASAAPMLTEAELAALRAGRPVPQLPPADHRVAVASAREARTLADFRADLIGRSGVPVLRTVLQQRVFADRMMRCEECAETEPRHAGLPGKLVRPEHGKRLFRI